MSFEPGSRLGAHEILAPIGVGGMGEVYRARDTKLGREVAIKVLPEAFSQDKERLDRFEREARLLASLNHPNIATLHGLEESDGIRFLVMELVEGETLAERIARGSIPVEEALALFKQIAEGLEAAHDKGVIHRDLKPANVKVTPEGKIKVLDFGLAKAFAEEQPPPNLSESPTIARGTATGVILGTAPYMSPEQARGKAVDKRADIWAFGCCLFESLTGKSPFLGETVTDTIARIVEREPDWKALPQDTPASALRLLRQCLQKNPGRRLRDIGDARLQIEDTAGEPETTTLASTRPLSWKMTAAVAVLALLVGGFAVWSFTRPQLPPVTRFVIPIPPRNNLTEIGARAILSPGGRLLVYVGTHDGQEHLFLRPMDRLEATPIRGTEGARQPFFSPDGQWVAFYTSSELKKVRITGSPPSTVADGISGFPGGGSWGADDHIIFSPDTSAALFRVSAAGGIPEAITTLNADQGERAHRLPELLPGGKAILYTAFVESAHRTNIVVQSLESKEGRVLVEGGMGPRYLSSGHVLFLQEGTLVAVPFDLDRLQVTGMPFPLVENVAVHVYGDRARPQYTVSQDGTLAYLSEQPGFRQGTLMWVDRQGAATSVSDVKRRFLAPRLSPDGRRLAVTVLDGATGGRDIWILELSRGTLTRFTFGPYISTDPVWTPDGGSIAFASRPPGGVFNIFTKSAEATGEPVQLTSYEDARTFPRSWSPDGQKLVYHRSRGAVDIEMLSLEAEPKTEVILATPFIEMEPSVSPDGRWLAYVSDESGRWEVYVRRFLGPDRRWQVSSDGGEEPAWAQNGRELFYRNGDKMMVVTVSTNPDFSPAAPVLLFEGRYDVDPLGNDTRNYDVTPDGQRFLMIRRDDDPERQLNVVLNWFQELKRLVPTEN
jgi:serine/threonine protein kinase